MNKKPILLLAAMAGCLALPTASLVSANEEADIAKTALAGFANGYRASGSYTLSYHYPEGVTAADFATGDSFVRDYGYLVEEDGSRTKVVREITSSGNILHLEGEDGAAYTESLDRYNQVVLVKETEMLADVLFTDKYGDPMSYIVPSDLSGSEKLTLTGTKASYLLDAFFEVSFPCTGAELTIDESGYVTALDFVAPVREAGIDLGGTGNFLSIETTLEAHIDFSYSIPAFAHLEPLAYENAALKAAFEAMGDNYTIYATSNYAMADAIVYRTESDIYVHLDAGVSYPVAGDILYRHRTGSVYMCYVYDGSSFAMSGGLVQNPEDFLPDFASVISEQYRPEGPTSYVLDSSAVAFNGTLLMPDDLVSDFDSDGMSAYVTLGKDGRVSSIGCSYGYWYLMTSITTSYGNYGTTSLPAWLDLSTL